jgi:hypothetical protein
MKVLSNNLFCLRIAVVHVKRQEIGAKKRIGAYGKKNYALLLCCSTPSTHKFCIAVILRLLM